MTTRGEERRVVFRSVDDAPGSTLESPAALPGGVAEALVSLVASNRAGRGLSSLCAPSFFERALPLLERARDVVIVTGFFIPACIAPETDGPGGSVVLGRARGRLGKKVRIVTDVLCFDAVSACSSSVGGPSVLSVSSSGAMLTDGGDLLVFIERVGRASDGRYYNMRREDITRWVVPLDDTALTALARGIPVLGVGDGGNEAGMGYFRELFPSVLPDFAECCSVVPSTCALPVDVSSWGAYALAAALSVRNGRWLGHTDDEEIAMLRAMCDAGAVDGVTRRRDLSVDQFPRDEILGVVRGIRSVCPD